MYICDYNNWYVVANMNNDSGDGAVKTYPNVHKDFDGAPLISSFGTIASSFAHAAPHVGIYEFAYDIWPNGVASTGSTEVMIWTDKSGSYIAFVATTNMASGTVNLLSFFNHIIIPAAPPVAVVPPATPPVVPPIAAAPPVMAVVPLSPPVGVAVPPVPPTPPSLSPVGLELLEHPDAPSATIAAQASPTQGADEARARRLFSMKQPPLVFGVQQKCRPVGRLCQAVIPTVATGPVALRGMLNHYRREAA
jgi:hypothetical protein